MRKFEHNYELKWLLEPMKDEQIKEFIQFIEELNEADEQIRPDMDVYFNSCLISLYLYKVYAKQLRRNMIDVLYHTYDQEKVISRALMIKLVNTLTEMTEEVTETLTESNREFDINIRTKEGCPIEKIVEVLSGMPFISNGTFAYVKENIYKLTIELCVGIVDYDDEETEEEDNE